MWYIHKFNKSNEQVTEYTNNYKHPWTDYTRQTDKVTYGWKDKYKDMYLTFEALENGTFAFSNPLEYSLDAGSTWTSLSANTNTPTVNAGDSIMFRANLTPTQNGIGKFSSTGRYNAMGNPLSLIYGDNFQNVTNLSGKTYTFYNLFFASTKLVSAEHLALPATTLAPYCYYLMFYNCKSLTTAPELPSTTLARDCYNSMFFGCSALTTAPELPATTLAERCYQNMFDGCTLLTVAPALPATTLASYCYQAMFNNCTALTTAPALPATTLAQACYQTMFHGCTSLTTAPVLPATTMAQACYQTMFDGCTLLTVAPALPATTLAQYCYRGMFLGCTSLTTAPALPATTLANNCYGGYTTTYDGHTYSRRYEGMFTDCTSLTTAPELPATTLVDNCYQYMFSGCSSLTYIKAMFTTTPSDTYTEGWVSDVASTGTFVKNSSASWNVTGANGVPSGWTVETASE